MLIKLTFCKYKIAFILFFSFGFVFSQSITVKGTVTSDGIPLPGVNILVKGSSQGVVTDFDGLYEIEVDQSGTLVYSYVGFVTQDQNVNNRSTINVELLEDLAQLEEVIVVGYGTQKKKEVTGAVIKVESEDILRTAVSDIGTALQGQVAGVNIQASSGRPGESANVQIRGLGSINSNALGPLYVVDGIPFEGNPNIAPEQIASIDILKDGASAAVYGTRASNGVILITTKKGSPGKMKVELSHYVGIQNITSGTPLMNTKQQMYHEEVMLEALGRDPLIFFFNPKALDNDNDFVGDVQRDNAMIKNYNLDISGGVKNLSLNFNTNYFDQKGVLVNSDFDRLTTRLTGNFKKDRFTAFATISFTREGRNQEPWSLYEYGIAQNPWQPALNQNPGAGENSVILNVRNPILYSYLSRELDNIDERKVQSSNIALALEYEILNGLKYKVSLGRNTYDYQRKFFRPQYLVYGNDGSLNPTASRIQALLDEDFTFSNRESIENIVTYNKNFGNHTFNLTGVLSYERFRLKTVGTGVIFSEDSSNDIQNLGSGSEATSPTGFNEERTLSGKLIRLQYNYAGKYLLSGSYRRDGSSKFSEDNRYGDFFGFSAGWNISDEDFFKVDAINNMKLRASWAEVGNQDIASYSFIPTIQSGINYPFGPNEDLNFGLIQRSYVDPNIKWETTISKNIGLDLSMFSNRFNFTVDLYQNDKEDMLLQERLPPSTGTYQPRAAGIYDVKVVNAGNMVNKGLEISASYRDQTSYGLKYNISGTFTKNINEVTDLNGVLRGYANGRPVLSQGENVDYTTFLAKGYEAGAFFLVQHAGIIKTQEQLDAYKAIDGSAQLGDMMYVDQDGNNSIDENDRVYSGSGQADFEAGLNLGLEYKNLDFFVQTYLSYGAEIYNGAKLYAYQQGRHAYLYHMWTPQNPDSDIATSRQNAFHNNVRARSDYFIEDGTYYRIRNLTLGYTIPGLEKTGIEKLRIYLTSVNPFTFTNYDGYDPEVGGDGIFTRGVDRGNYPVTRQFHMGVQLKF